MTLFDQVQRALTAEGIAASLETLLLVVRMHDDSAHVSIRRAPTDNEAKEWFKADGRRFIEPVAIGRVQGDTEPTVLPPHRVIESSESLPHIADEAYVWRGYGRNTRGVIKFRRGRFAGEVNAPSVDDAIAVARGFSALLA